MNKYLLSTFVLVLAGCGGGGGSSHSNEPANVYLDSMEPNNWEIGPIINGVNYSVNMPLHPAKHKDGWVIEIPYPNAEAGSVHYVTMPVDSLEGKSKVSMNYRVETDSGSVIFPTNFPKSPSILTLYFEREGLGWTEKYEDWRWYASFSKQSPISAGERKIEAKFDQNWTAVLTSSRQNNPSAYNESLKNAGRIGFVLGGGDGLGHGVTSTGPARIIITSFKVE